MTTNKQTLIIAAITSRPYVKFAIEAGYEVITIDCFADGDTKRLASESYKISQEKGQLNSTQLLKIITSIDLDSVIGFCYGAGFEKAPSVLNDIRRYVLILGNAVAVIRQTKAPAHFFKLCADLEVTHPKVIFKKPLITDGWLQKSIGGSGGDHIVSAADSKVIGPNVYYQQFLEGKSVSCLFLATEDEVKIVGFNEQWTNSVVGSPYLYGGAVSHADINLTAQKRFTEYVTKLTLALGLVGLNSCDAVCMGNDVAVLEINPRLSASADLYTFEPYRLMAMHVAACQKRLNVNSGNDHYLKTEIQTHKNSQAHQVIYAKCDTLVSATNAWPAWVSDEPAVEEYFVAGMPICTVLAEAATPAQAKQLVQARALVFENKYLI